VKRLLRKLISRSFSSSLSSSDVSPAAVARMQEGLSGEGNGREICPVPANGETAENDDDDDDEDEKNSEITAKRISDPLIASGGVVGPIDRS
jgi:hypothetical protein